MDFFESVYREGTAPWDVAGPQPAFVELERERLIRGSVLDAGCGTGENALFLAAAGYDTWGVDLAPEALRQAREKAKKRGISVRFEIADALALDRLGRRFDTVVDSGLFHSFNDEERADFIHGLAAVLKPSGFYLMLCFSELATGPGGPRRITREEIRNAFRTEDGWTVLEIRIAYFATRLDPPWDRTPAWLAIIERRRGALCRP